MAEYGLELSHVSGEGQENVTADGFDLTESGDLYFWKTNQTGRKELVIIYNARRWLTVFEIEED